MAFDGYTEQVRVLLEQGLSNRAVAAQLGIKLRSVQARATYLRGKGLLPPHSTFALRLGQRIKELALEGKTADEISAATGLSAPIIRRRISRMMASDELPRVAARRAGTLDRPASASMITYRYGKKLGSLTHMLCSMPPEQMHWVLEQVPEGSTLSDLLRSFIVDAYLGETGQ